MARLGTRLEYLSAGETLFAANLNESEDRKLSGPEAQILTLLGAGKQSSDIAAGIGMDQVAVKEHIKSILRKAMGSSGKITRQKGPALRSSEHSTSKMLGHSLAE